MKGFLCVAMLLLFANAACANATPDLNDALAKVQSSISDSHDMATSDEQSMRDEAIQRAAVVYGAQSGRYYRWQQLEKRLLTRNHLLNRVFNFGAMYLDDGLIQPPVLDQSSNVTNISNQGQIRELVNNVYRVLIPASFKSRPITWQSFLLPDSLAQPAEPRAALKPRNDHEKKLWAKFIDKGWSQGIIEANSELSARLDSLSNAYQGMALYTMLAMRGMIEPPQVVKSEKQVNSSGDTMAVGVHRQVIAKKSYFVDQPDRWKPVYYDHDFSGGKLQ